MKGIFSIVSAVAIAGSAMAQDASGTAAAPATAPAAEAFSLKGFGFNEKINFYNLGSGNVTEFVQDFTWNASDDTQFHFAVPVYTDGNTGAGMSVLGVKLTTHDAPFKFVDAIHLGFDLKLPTDSAGFGGDSVNPVIGVGAEGKTGIDNLSWNAGFDWEWNSEGDYLPIFGGLVEEDVLHVKAGLGYVICSGLDFNVNYNFWSLDGAGSLNTIGPGFSYEVCKNADFDFSCDIPFAEDDASDLDLVVRFGLNVKF